MGKIKVNMLSIADSVKAQGVGSAYNELIELLNKYGKNDLEIVKNKGLNYDVLHMHTTDIVSFIKQRLTKNTTLTYVHFLPNTLNGALKMPKLFMNIYAWWIKKCYLKSDYLVVVNSNYIDEMVKYGYDKNRIFYIPNYVSNNNFYVISEKDKEKYRKKYNYKKDDFIVVGVGQLHKGKGVLDFIKLAYENPDIKFLWVGGFTFGKLMDGYKKIKEVYDNPPSNLTFSGIVDRNEVNILCNISDVFFLPSYYESFALVALEAALTEKPIILRNLDIYKKLYYDNVLYGNNKNFIDLIKKLKTDKDEYNKYVKLSKNIKKMFSEEEIYKKWINLYREISKKI